MDQNCSVKIYLKFFLLVLILVFGLSQLYSGNTSFKMQKKAPFLMEGDKIVYFDISGEKGILKKTELLNNGYSLIIVFSNNCFSCNKNIPLWNRMSLLKGLKTYGIILKNENLGKFHKIKETKFNLYSPNDINEFKNNFKMNEGIDYTILCKGNEVVYFQMGLLSVDNYFQIKDIVSKN